MVVYHSKSRQIGKTYTKFHLLWIYFKIFYNLSNMLTTILLGFRNDIYYIEKNNNSKIFYTFVLYF